MTRRQVRILSMDDDTIRRHTVEILSMGISAAVRGPHDLDPRYADALRQLLRDGPAQIVLPASARGGEVRAAAPDFVTIEQALAGTDSVSSRTVRTWARDGKVRAERRGRDWLVSRSDVRRMIEKRTE